MKVRHLLASYGPTQLHVIFQAFDPAWAAERGRMRLAHAILAVAQENEDTAGLKNAALEQMALDYGSRS